MNTFNIILTLAVPILVVGYIIWDLLISKVSKYTAESTEKTLNKSEVRKNGFGISYERGSNNGKYIPRMEILDNAKDIIKTMF